MYSDDGQTTKGQLNIDRPLALSCQWGWGYAYSLLSARPRSPERLRSIGG